MSTRARACCINDLTSSVCPQIHALETYIFGGVEKKLLKGFVKWFTQKIRNLTSGFSTSVKIIFAVVYSLSSFARFGAAQSECAISKCAISISLFKIDLFE